MADDVISSTLSKCETNKITQPNIDIVSNVQNNENTNVSDHKSACFKIPAVKITSFKESDTSCKLDCIKNIKVDTTSQESNSKTIKDQEDSKLDVLSKKEQSFSPAEQLKNNDIPIPYKEPTWGGICKKYYYFEIVKNGTVIDKLNLTTKSFYVFGRLPNCDIKMEHPSLSRYHAVVQYCIDDTARHQIGWYLYDLESTHGTFINKRKITPRRYCRLHVGHVVKFAGSTRLHILQGPEEDEEKESDLSITEMKEKREREMKEKQLLEHLDKEVTEDDTSNDEGCSWGLDKYEEDQEPDQDPVEGMEIQYEELHLDDPKKTLRGFFEREGYDFPEYQTEEEGWGKHKCWLELPIDGPNGSPIIAEASVSGKKKESVIACALEACRILDQHGMLRQATHESRKRKMKNWEENDYYGSDDDTFLDRTGDIERKRRLRMKRFGKKQETAETYDSLKSKLEAVTDEIAMIQGKLDEAKSKAESLEAEGMDALDAYMTSIKRGAMDTKTKMNLKRQLFELRQKQQAVQKLVNIAKPVLPTLTTSVTCDKTRQKQMLPLIGKIKGRNKLHLPSLGPRQIVETPRSGDSLEVEEEDDDDGQEKDKEKEEDTEQPSVLAQSQNSPISSFEIVKDNKYLEPESSDTECRQTVLSSELSDIESRKHDASTTDSHPGQISLSHRTCVIHSNEPNELKKNDSTEKASISADCKDISGPEIPIRDHAKKFKKEKMDEMPFVAEIPVKQKSQHSSNIKKKKPPVLSKEYCDDDPDYSTWVPPQGQTGDGKTHLNQKYGY